MRKYFFFVPPTFLDGVARTFDLFGTFDSFNVGRTPAEHDLVSMRDDWKAVGEDLQAALGKAKATLATHEQQPLRRGQ